MYFHCLLACAASDGKSAFIFVFILQYVTCLFSMSAFKRFLFITEFQHLTMMFLDIVFEGSSSWSLLSCLNLWVYSFHHIWKKICKYYFNYIFVLSFLSSPAETPVAHISSHFMLYCRLLVCFSPWSFSFLHFG